MVFENCVKRLRAAYALSFAMGSGKRLHLADLRAAGLIPQPGRGPKERRGG